MEEKNQEVDKRKKKRNDKKAKLFLLSNLHGKNPKRNKMFDEYDRLTFETIVVGYYLTKPDAVVD